VNARGHSPDRLSEEWTRVAAFALDGSDRDAGGRPLDESGEGGPEFPGQGGEARGDR
jgi:hypothetical protein